MANIEYGNKIPQKLEFGEGLVGLFVVVKGIIQHVCGGEYKIIIWTFSNLAQTLTSSNLTGSRAELEMCQSDQILIRGKEGSGWTARW